MVMGRRVNKCTTGESTDVMRDALWLTKVVAYHIPGGPVFYLLPFSDVLGMGLMAQ